jgi:tetratricopeptide (TPR) repeat protein
MANVDHASNQPVQPALSDLLVDYLRGQATRHAVGFGNAESKGEVVPFEAVPVQRVDAGLAWREAVVVARYFLPHYEGAALSENEPSTWPAPPEWAATVNSLEAAAAIAFSFGNYPQLVRDLQALLAANNLSALLPTQADPVSNSALRDWAAASAREPRYPQILFTVGVLRLARQFDEAAQLLHRHRAAMPAHWQAAYANEEAALLWHRGQVEQAARLWQKQASTIPVLFNRGMSALFLGRPAEARPALAEAIAQLSESDGWHHLGGLYLALAEMR